MAVERLDVGSVQCAVVQIRRPLMFDDATRDVHSAGLHRVEHEPDLPLVIEVLELFVRYGRNFHIEGSLREQRVAVPPGANLLFGLWNFLAGPHRVDQSDETDVGSGTFESDGARVRQRPAQRPASQDERTRTTDLKKLGNVLLRAFLDGTLDPFKSVDRGVRRQSLDQGLVDHRRATGRVEHEHRHGIDAVFRRSQGADEPLEFTGLQIFTDVGGQLLNGRCRLHLLDGDGALGAFR